MNILILFFTGLIAGFLVSIVQKTNVQSPNSDIALGMLGALIAGGFIAQFTHVNPVIILMSIAGAVLFIEIGRSIPEHH